MSIPTAAVHGVPDPLPEHLCVLDVREDDEWEAGRLENSLHIPLRELGQRFTELPGGGQVLVVCRSGHRSEAATAYLVDQGIDAVNLAGGLLAWHGAGRPLTTDDGRPGVVV